MNISQGRKLTYHQTVYEKGKYNSDGTPRRWRVSGKVQTWKRDKNRIRIPIKHGLYDNDAITENTIKYYVTKEPKNKSKHIRKSKKVSSGIQLLLDFVTLKDIK